MELNHVDDRKESSLKKQVLVGFIDAFLVLLVTITLLIYVPLSFAQLASNFNGSLMVVIAFIIYRILALLFFNGTIGMKLLRSTLLNSEQKPISIGEKCLAAVFILFKGVDYYDK